MLYNSKIIKSPNIPLDTPKVSHLSNILKACLCEGNNFSLDRPYCPSKVIKNPIINKEQTYIISASNNENCTINTAVFPSYDEISSLEDTLEVKEQETLEKPLEDLLEEVKKQGEEIIEKAKQDANTIIENAKLQAETMFLTAQQEIEQCKKDAFEEGFKQGQEQGYESIKNTLAQAQSVLKASLESKAQIINNAEPEIINLILEIAKKVIHTEVTMNKNIIVSIVKDGLYKLGKTAIVQIRVNPLDIESLQSNWNKLSEMVQGIEIVPDENVEQGGCIINSQLGSIDAQISTQYDSIVKSLLSLLRQ